MLVEAAPSPLRGLGCSRRPLASLASPPRPRQVQRAVGSPASPTQTPPQAALPSGPTASSSRPSWPPPRSTRSAPTPHPLHPPSQPPSRLQPCPPRPAGAHLRTQPQRLGRSNKDKSWQLAPDSERCGSSSSCSPSCVRGSTSCGCVRKSSLAPMSGREFSKSIA